MGDRFDTVMEKVWPDVRKAVYSGLEDLVADLLPTETTDDPRPYRISSVDWVSASGYEDLLTAAAGNVQYAHQLRRTFRVPLNNIRTLTRDQRDGLVDFGKSTRAVERDYTLRLLSAACQDKGPLEKACLEALLTSHPGAYRLLSGLPQDEADDLKRRGLIEDHRRPPLPDGVRGLLVPLDRGPGIRRVVDNLELTWYRDSDDVVLELSVLFFVHGAHVWRFGPAQAPLQGLPAAPTPAVAPTLDSA